MTPQRKFEVGHTYSLHELGDLAMNLRMAHCKSTDAGLLIIFKEPDSKLYWLNGPLKGPGTNFFLFMGEQETKSQLWQVVKDSFASIRHDKHALDAETWLDNLELAIFSADFIADVADSLDWNE